VKEKSDEIYVDFFDLLIILAINFPIFLLLAILKYLGWVSDTLSAFLLILLSVLIVWGFHLILKQKGYGIGSWFRISSFGPDLVWSVITFPGIFGVYLVMSFLTAFICGCHIIRIVFSGCRRGDLQRSNLWISETFLFSRICHDFDLGGLCGCASFPRLDETFCFRNAFKFAIL
jgi:hypothetical protein